MEVTTGCVVSTRVGESGDVGEKEPVIDGG